MLRIRFEWFLSVGLLFFVACADTDNLDGYFLDSGVVDSATDVPSTDSGADVLDAGIDAGDTVVDAGVDAGFDAGVVTTSFCFEAELATRTNSNSPFQLLSDPTASGGQYIGTTDDGALTYGSVTHDPSLGAGRATLMVMLPDAGPWYVFARARTVTNATDTNTTNDDSFWVNVDGSFKRWNEIVAVDTWTWQRVVDSDVTDVGGNPVQLQVTASGVQSLIFDVREDGAQLDALYLSKDTTIPTANCE